MRLKQIVVAGLFAGLALSMPIASASAAWHQRGLAPSLGNALGAVFVGAATIATAPFAIVAGVTGAPYRYGQPRGYGPPRTYHRPPQHPYYGPPPRAYGYAPVPPPNYYPPRPRYYGYPQPYYGY